jgi:hypothetical protein
LFLLLGYRDRDRVPAFAVGTDGATVWLLSECLIEESRFFIVSPKDVVVASPYDADDRVQWLIDHWQVVTEEKSGLHNFM